MSINIGATVSNPVVLTPAPVSLTLTPNTHAVTGVSNNKIDVSVSIASLTLTKLNTQVGANVIVQTSLPTMSLTGFNNPVTSTPVQGNVTVDASTASLVLSASSTTVFSSGDWNSRSGATGVVMATNFNVSDDVFDFAVDPASHFEHETTIKRSGGGALKIIHLNTDTTAGWDWWRFLDDTMEPFGSAESGLRDEYYVTYSVYIPQSYYDWIFIMDSSSHKKFSITSQKPSNTVNPATRAALSFVGNPFNGSSVLNEYVVNDYGQTMYPMIYSNQPDGTARAFDFNNVPESADFQYQNTVDAGVQTGTPLAYPGDTRSQTLRNLVAQTGMHNNYGKPTTGGSRLAQTKPHPDPIAAGPKWLSGWNHIKYRLKFPTTWTGTDGEFDAWLAHDGDTSWQQFLSVTGTQSGGQSVKFHNSAESAQGVPYNGGVDGWYHLGIWLTAFRTSGVAEASRPDTHLIYDEVIVSTNDIDLPVAPQGVVDLMSVGTIIEIDDPINNHRPEPGSGAVEGEVSQAIWDSLIGGAVGWRGIIDAWNGGGHDRSTGKSYVTSAGHATYGGYEVYEFDALATVPGWTRLNDPILNPQTGGLTIGSGATLGPNTVHTYDGVQAWRGRYLYIEGGGLFPTGSGANPGWVFDLETQLWAATPLSAYTLPTANANMCFYHEPLNELWSWRDGPTGQWVRLDGETLADNGAVGGGPASNWFGDGICEHSPFYEKVLYMGRNNTGTGEAPVYIWDVSNASSVPAYTTPAITGDTAIAGANQPGMTWCEKINKFVAWSGGGGAVARNVLVTIDIGQDPIVFTEHTLTGVTPAAPAGDYNGTYGRFRYVPQKDVFVGYNSVFNSTYIFKLPADA